MIPTTNGAAAEYVALRARDLARRPVSAGHVKAAAMPLSGHPGCSRERRMIAMRTVAPSGIDVRVPKFLRRNRPDEVRDPARIRVGTARARRSACS